MHPNSRMQTALSTLTFLLLLFLDTARAQNFVPTTSSANFPGCGVGCNLLLQAQTLCVPPAVAVTSQFTYENCFCQSSFLQGLYSSPDAVCTAECTIESDRVLLQKWFTGFCAAVGQGVDPLATTTGTPTTATQSVVVVTVTSTNSASGATGTGTGTGSASRPAPKTQSWIEGHWKWILMLGILLIGFGLLTWLLIWLKRRHRRKVDERRAAMSGFPTETEKRAGAGSATPDLWGPHQHMAQTRGYEYQDGQDMASGGVLGAPAGHRDKRRSRRRRSRDRNEMSQIDERPSNSRRRSSKGKSTPLERTASNEPEIGPVDRSRSRSRRSRNPDSDLEGGSNPEHSRRLREVRGTRRNRNIDPP